MIPPNIAPEPKDKEATSENQVYFLDKRPDVAYVPELGPSVLVVVAQESIFGHRRAGSNGHGKAKAEQARHDRHVIAKKWAAN
jgi:hypothetical protein